MALSQDPGGPPLKHAIQFISRWCAVSLAGLGAFKVVMVGGCSEYPPGAEPRAFFIAAVAFLALDGLTELVWRVVRHILQRASDDRL